MSGLIPETRLLNLKSVYSFNSFGAINILAPQLSD